MTDHLNMRYTEWLPLNFENNIVSWDTVIASELYDLNKDPEQTVNVVYEPAHSDAVNKMREYLRHEWPGALMENKKVIHNNGFTYKKLTRIKNNFIRDKEKDTEIEIDILNYKSKSLAKTCLM